MKRSVSFFMCIVVAFTFMGGFFFDSFAVTAEAASYKTPYYYKQLSEKEQGYYDKMKEAVIGCKKSVKLKTAIDEDTLQKLVDLMYYYDVSCFNLSGASARTGSSYTEVYFEYAYSKENYDKMIASLNKRADKIIASFDEDTKIYTKIKTIHDYIINHTEYDKDFSMAGLAYGALAKGRAKCDGYSQAFNYICSRAGIRVINVIGYAGESHMWNKVYYNKNWYNIDVTFDDPVSNYKENLTYDYFMVDDKTFGRDHTPDPCRFEIPAATDPTKSYYAVYKLTASDTETAKTVLINNIAKAAKKGKSGTTIRFDSDGTFNSTVNALRADNGKLMRDILKKAYKKSGVDFYTGGYLSSANPNTLTFEVFIFYPDTSLDDYFENTSAVDSEMRDFLGELGVAA